MFLAVATFLIASVAATLLTPLVIRLAWRFDLLDHPAERKVHRDPVPRFGGVAIFGAFLIALAGGFLVSGYPFTLLGRVNYYWIGYLAGAFLVFLCGVADDLKGLGAPAKFSIQFLAAGICWYSGFQITIVTNPFNGDLALGWMSLPFTLLWVVGVTNAVNMIDGLDGLAGGVCLIVTASVGAISAALGQFPVTIICIALAGSLLGFLRYNSTPARVFMGDSGSMFLGFTLAVISMRGSQKSATAIAILVPLLALGLPVLDTLLVMARRAWIVGGESRGKGLRAMVGESRRIFSADREHVHHNLIELGLSHRNSVWVLYGICLLFAVTAFFLTVSNSLAVGAALAALSIGSVVAIKAFVLIRRRGSGGPGGAAARRESAQAGPAREALLESRHRPTGVRAG